ncbi:Ref family recombination enhancement nuclease [Citrobacter europaeus]|nr:Ref family recombination enhancement nuclease [Citrobacter europaeus]
MSRSKNKAEKLHLSRVADLNCIVCRNEGLGETPAEIHHCSSGTGMSVRADNFHVIPLCHTHHRTGGHGVAIHAGRQSWESKFGTETELLVQVLYELGESTHA